MANYGIEITDPDVDIEEAAPEEFVFSSEYKTLRIHDRNSGVVDSGVSSGLVTIPHGLGYVPKFLVHVDPGQLGNYYIAPYVPTGIFGTPLIQAYADETNLYIKASEDSQTTDYSLESDLANCMAREIETVGYFTGGWTVGRAGDGSYWYGAVRFLGIALQQGQTVSSALLNLYIASRDGSGQVKINLWGIDEDNTGEFDSGTVATARSKTTASASANTTLSLGDTLTIGVTSLVQEIIDRGGWSNGNALGIMFWDNASSNGNGYYQIGDNSGTFLRITISTPTIANYKYTIFLNKLE